MLPDRGRTVEEIRHFVHFGRPGELVDQIVDDSVRLGAMDYSDLRQLPEVSSAPSMPPVKPPRDPGFVAREIANDLAAVFVDDAAVRIFSAMMAAEISKGESPTVQTVAQLEKLAWSSARVLWNGRGK